MSVGIKRIFLLCASFLLACFVLHAFKEEEPRLPAMELEAVSAPKTEPRLPFQASKDGEKEKGFATFAEAAAYAKSGASGEVRYNDGEKPIFSASAPRKESAKTDAPALGQLPELARGCEVTALAMLLGQAGIQTDKMKLAEQIKKSPETYRREGANVWFGNPNDGFVGDIRTFANPGYAVYHAPVKELAEAYLPGRAIDLTGAEFEDALAFTSENAAVWVIANAEFRKLPAEDFQTWQTPSGAVQITMKEHAVLITGYDGKYVYFNNPLTGGKNEKAPKGDFEEAWKQMGSQAISYTN